MSDYLPCRDWKRGDVCRFVCTLGLDPSTPAIDPITAVLGSACADSGSRSSEKGGETTNPTANRSRIVGPFEVKDGSLDLRDSLRGGTWVRH